MKDYLLVFRMDYSTIPGGTPEEVAAMTQRWMDWIAGIAGKGQLADRGNRLDPSSGRVLRASQVTNGPYTEIKESIGGYTMIKANSYDDAVAMAKGCPILTINGSVEVREVSVLP